MQLVETRCFGKFVKGMDVESYKHVFLEIIGLVLVIHTLIRENIVMFVSLVYGRSL